MKELAVSVGDSEQITWTDNGSATAVTRSAGSGLASNAVITVVRDPAGYQVAGLRCGGP
ncbi:hypothetical protein ACFXPA_45215 [Amycolatopsis sp. NPDC059090]|uniref:hypothetical protein n=1 Tax=Amycolatopsis sp. NPDC059090 TaxID=3346723 RepID=UPI00367036C4